MYKLSGVGENGHDQGLDALKNLVRRMNRRIPDSWRKNRRAAGICAALLGRCEGFDPAFHSELSRAVDRCCAQTQTAQGTVRREMLREFVRGWVTPSEFYKFRLLQKSDEQRRGFISEYEGLAIFKNPAFNILPNDKYARYQLFSGYFHREVLRIKGQEGQSEEALYQAFIARNQTFIAKTIMGAKGHGVRKCGANEAPDVATLLALMGGACIVEALIDQGGELAAFHPQSVNTIRFVTAANDAGEVSALFALLRVGRGDSVVDNVGSGGLVAGIDMESGRVCTDGLCGWDYYAEHPDTHVPFRGTQIPSWKELRQMACRMHAEQPAQRVFGFDFAWTTGGWDIVEVNPAPSFVSWQTLAQRGIRPVLTGKHIL